MRPDLDGIKARAHSGNYLRHGSLANADCILGFAFGFRQDNIIRPGLSNEDLALFILKYCGALPKIVQFEIAQALPPNMGEIFRIEKHRKAGMYLDTHEVAAQALEIMKKHSWQTAVLVAHPGHIPRADAIALKLGISTIALDGLQAIRFDPNSAQPWTRDQSSWAAHEDEAIDSNYDQGWI